MSSEITAVVENLRTFFKSGKTKGLDFRIEQLKRLKKVLSDNEEAISEALKEDLGKSRFESYVSEIGILLNEIEHAVKNLRSWAKPKRVHTPPIHFPATSHLYSEPLGVTLILGPWNYPVQLVIAPLIGSMAAGNCSLLKPSELAPKSSRLISRLIRDNFDPGYVTVVEGDSGTAQQLLEQTFDYIFFTGGTSVGRSIAMAAAKNLTPATLELGGKSPCIVDSDIHVTHTAERIVWGKFFNAGQTCVAPDYLLVQNNIKSGLIEAMKETINRFYGPDPKTSPDYARIINERHFQRLKGLLNGDIVYGGETDADKRYIAPTLVDKVGWDDDVMVDEIFGPILPILGYDNLEECITRINSRPKPLALYVFSNDRQIQTRVLEETSAGGCTINDTLVHLSTAALPFGGVGESGYGKYHGRASFDLFSNKKSVMRRWFALDVPFRYPPFENKLPIVKRLMRYLG